MTVLLDGGMGQELRLRGFNADAKVAGLALIESPSVVCDVHREFIAAGADVITAWNYAVTPHRLALSDGGAKLVHPGGAKLVHLTLCGTRCWGVVPVVHRRDPRCFE